MLSLRPALALLLLAALPAAAGTRLPDPLERLLPPRPEMENYQDQSRFVADVLAWERKRQALLQKLERGELTLEQKNEGTRHENDWHHVTGPEDLETAINNARGYVQPRYREKYRFNRTTHLSFPLEHLSTDVMAHEVIPSDPKPPLSRELEQLPEQVLGQLERVQDLTQSLPPATAGEKP